jgi:hypothetical protein
MSLMWTLRRLIDPAAREEDGDREQQLRRAPSPVATGPGASPVWTPPRHARWGQCRVCARYVKDSRFCTACLAETVKPL